VQESGGAAGIASAAGIAPRRARNPQESHRNSQFFASLLPEAVQSVPRSDAIIEVMVSIFGVVDRFVILMDRSRNKTRYGALSAKLTSAAVKTSKRRK
jgi:hypothetical protein